MFLAFQDNLSFGTLHWTVNTPSLHCIFLDVAITLLNGSISTTIHKKELNLHLYLPPFSCHPPGMLKGLIYGSFHRILRLTTEKTDQISLLRKFSRNLLRRGYDRKTIVSLFHSARRHYEMNPPSLEPNTSSNSIPDNWGKRKSKRTRSLDDGYVKL